MDIGQLFLDETAARFEAVKRLGEAALAQLREEDWHWAPSAESNGAAVIVQHLAGNMRSRWATFPREDGEGEGRDRDAEFEDAKMDGAALLALWEDGWEFLFAALARLSPADLARAVTIRSEQLSVLHAIERQLSHYSYHVGQLVYLAKLRRGENWRTLSIARGGSRAFNEAMTRPVKST